MNELLYKNIEQKVISKLAKNGFITSVIDVSNALESVEYAQTLFGGQGLEGDLEDSGYIIAESLSADEIKSIFKHD